MLSGRELDAAKIGSQTKTIENNPSEKTGRGFAYVSGQTEVVCQTSVRRTVALQGTVK